MYKLKSQYVQFIQNLYAWYLCNCALMIYHYYDIPHGDFNNWKYLQYYRVNMMVNQHSALTQRWNYAEETTTHTIPGVKWLKIHVALDFLLISNIMEYAVHQTVWVIWNKVSFNVINFAVLNYAGTTIFSLSVGS